MVWDKQLVMQPMNRRDLKTYINTSITINEPVSAKTVRITKLSLLLPARCWMIKLFSWGHTDQSFGKETNKCVPEWTWRELYLITIMD